MNFINIFSGTIQTRFMNIFLKKGKKFWVENLFFKFFYFMNNYVLKHATIQKNNFFFETNNNKKHFFDKFKRQKEIFIVEANEIEDVDSDNKAVTNLYKNYQEDDIVKTIKQEQGSVAFKSKSSVNDHVDYLKNQRLPFEFSYKKKGKITSNNVLMNGELHNTINERTHKPTNEKEADEFFLFNKNPITKPQVIKASPKYSNKYIYLLRDSSNKKEPFLKSNSLRITARYLLKYKAVFFILLMGLLIQKKKLRAAVKNEKKNINIVVNSEYSKKKIQDLIFKTDSDSVELFLEKKLIKNKILLRKLFNKIKKNYFYYFQTRLNPVYFLLTQFVIYHIIYQLVPFLGVRMTAVATKSNLKRKGRRRKPSGIPILLNGRSQVTKALSFFKKGFFPDGYNRKKAKLKEYNFFSMFISEMSSFIITGETSRALLLKRKLYRSVVEFRTNYHFRWLSSKFI